MRESALCAIPARAGSKRLPGKNLLPLGGKPMIAHTIETARASGLFDEVYVCTEDDRIADVARQFGAQVPILMPKELCDDLVASHEPCLRLAELVAEKRGRAIDTLVCLQPSSPLRSVEDLQSALRVFVDGGYDFLVSVTPIDPHYFHWAVVPESGENWRMHFGDEYLADRSELPPAFRPNGAIKIARRGALRETGHFFGARLGVVQTPEERSVHVATQFEFDLCEWLLTRRTA